MKKFLIFAQMLIVKFPTIFYIYYFIFNCRKIPRHLIKGLISFSFVLSGHHLALPRTTNHFEKQLPKNPVTDQAACELYVEKYVCP